jgi:ATP-dependent metalloprotease FtsH
MKRRREILVGLLAGILVFCAWQGLNIVPVLLLGGLALVLTQMNGQRVGSGKKYVSLGGATRPSGVGFDDIGGQETAKRELLEALDFVRDEAGLARLGIRPLKGILLVGPPGTGKTLLAKAAANYTDSAFISTAGSEFIEVYAGVGAQRVRGLFDAARESAKREQKRHAIVFIDELEVIGGKRGNHTSHLEYDQTLNQLLVEMDGLGSADGVRVLVIGATNRVDLLDSALTRPGRFDRTVQVDLPDKDGREQILSLHTKNKPLALDVDLGELARQTFGFSGAHLESLANEAAILALRAGQDEIGQRQLLEAVDKVILGERVERRPSADELRRVALHESGHAVISELTNPGSVATVTISPRGQTLGYVRHNPAVDTYLETRTALEGDIRVALAGAVAEELTLGERSTGALNDYEQASAAARRMVEAGMSRLGVIDRQLIADRTLATAVAEIIREQDGLTRAELSLRLPLLQSLTDLLLNAETVSGDALRSLLNSAVTPD